MDKEQVNESCRELTSEEKKGTMSKFKSFDEVPESWKSRCSNNGYERYIDEDGDRRYVDNNEKVVEKNITFYSICEHHLLPFYGKAHIAYIPDGKVVGLSKLARTVEVFARRLQLQEQLTAQIADILMESLNPKGVCVILEAEHMCMTMRGIKKPGSQTVTVVKRGEFSNNPELINLFFQMIK